MSQSRRIAPATYVRHCAEGHRLGRASTARTCAACSSSESSSGECPTHRGMRSSPTHRRMWRAPMPCCIPILLPRLVLVMSPCRPVALSGSALGCALGLPWLARPGRCSRSLQRPTHHCATPTGPNRPWTNGLPWLPVGQSAPQVRLPAEHDDDRHAHVLRAEPRRQVSAPARGRARPQQLPALPPRRRT